MGAILASILMRQHSAVPLVQQNKFGLPIPDVIHKVLSEEDIGYKDVLVIGDVHGCLGELKELLRRFNIDVANTIFLFCGDILNKGPLNIETLHYVRRLPNCHVVRGNHEEHILRHYFTLQKDPSAIHSFSQKYSWITDLTADDVEYLVNLPYTISVPSLSAIIVHAGLYPWIPLNQQRLQDMVLMRDIIGPDSQQPEATKTFGDGLPWASCWTGPEHVYFGHDARRGLQQYRHATGLDTGCVYGGHLAAKYLTGNKKLLLVKAPKMHRTPNNPIGPCEAPE